jgi:hypothetical protein
MWGYLQEFWDAVSGVVLDAWEYTAEWFQAVGNAVAGAVGGLFDWLLHYGNDFFVFMGWLISGIKQLFVIFTAPMSYVFTFLKAFWQTATKPPIEIEGALNVSTNAMGILQSIPYWATLTIVLGVGVLVVGAVGIIYLLLRI